MQPDDFTQPLLRRLRHDLLVVIDRHDLDVAAITSVLADIIGHCLSTAKNKRQLEDGILSINSLVQINARELFNDKSSLIVIDKEG